MLNAAPIAAATPLASLMTAPSQSPPQGDGGPPFSQALDRAAAQQRAACADTDSAAQAEPTPQGKAAAGSAPGQSRLNPTAPPGSARQGALRNAAARDAFPLAALADAAGIASPQVAIDDALEPDDGARAPELAGQALLELAAGLWGLPLPRAPASDRATSATPPDAATPRGGKTAALGADAPTQPAASVRDEVLAIGAEASRPGARPVAAGLATAPGLDAVAVAEDRRATIAGATPATLAHRAQLAAASGELQSGNEGLHLALGRLRQSAGPEGSESLPAAAATPPANAWALAAPRASENAAPFQAELKAALGTSEFASNLGSQLSVLVRDGIEHAQLKLNPAEMGPIEVRIRLDGTQAQVDFSAAHAATRQALQDAVPVLASALLDNGLTLTGGGVFEQPREPRGEARRDAPGGSASTGTTTREGPGPDTSPPRMPRARGVVDLYA